MYNLLLVDDEPIFKITFQKIIHWDETSFRLLGTAKDGVSALQRKEISDVIEFLEENYNKKLTLEDIADHVNLSREYLCRLFKSETETSLFDYLDSIRMRKASELLVSNKDLLVKEVANAVGIANPLFFSKKFKSFFGVSPTQYYDSIQHKTV